jgi:hypothetical protein
MNWPCLFGHGDRQTTRIDGVLHFTCERCQQSLGPVLAGEMITTPLPQVVAGQPTGKVRRVVRANVTPMRRQSER